MAKRTLACLAAVASIGAAGAAHAQTVPVTIVNNTGITGKMYVTVYGQDPANPTSYLVSDAAGQTKPLNTLNNTPSDYGFNTDSTSTYTFNVPRLNSGRIYISFCQPSYLTVTPTGNGSGPLAPNSPAPWNPSSKNHTSVIDFAEYTWGPDNNFNVNTTQVDSLGIPMKMVLQNASQTVTAGFKDSNSAQTVVKALVATPPWSTLLITDKKGRPTQVLSPNHGMEAGYKFPTNYWDSYIALVLATYSKAGKSFTLNNQVGSVTTPYTGTTSSTQITLKPTTGGAATVFNKPSSKDLWQNGPTFASGDSGPVASLQRWMQAAFLRSTFINSTNSISNCSVKPYQSLPQNLYSQYIHSASLNGKAYTFPYDDVCEQSSYNSVPAPTKLTLTLFPLSSTWNKMTCSN